MNKVAMSVDDEPGKRGLLRGGRPPYPHNLSKRQFETVTALSDTFLPSVEIPSGKEETDEPSAEFYGTSASMAGVPDQLAGLMSGKLSHPFVGLNRLTLWVLSTWWGTFALCGRNSLSDQFPYFQRFADVSQEKRESIVLSWSLSSFFLFRMLFKSMKFTTMIMFFSKASEKNSNPSWKAMGYCGQDPRFVKSGQLEDGLLEKEEKKTDEELQGPLHKFVIDADDDEGIISKAFSKAGFSTVASTDSTPFTVSCDAVVVGSGAGGSVVAGELAKAGHKVIVVEKGRYFARENLSLLEGPTMDEMYEGSGLISTDNLSIIVLAGSTVGGGSAINWSASIRTPDQVIDEWCEKHELKLFGSRTFQHATNVVCDRMDVQGEVTDEGLNNSVLRKGCLELGLPVITVPRNASKDHSCGWCHLGCKDGRKRSVTETWLADVVESGNGVILQSCNVSKVLHRPMNGKTRNVARGIVGEATNTKRTIVISSPITVVAGGALNSPSLLKRSGLKNPNIGKNLHLHPVIMAWGHFPESNEINWPEKEKKSYEGGIITSMCSIKSNSQKSGFDTVIQTPVLHTGMFSALMPWTSSADFRRRMTRFSRTAHLFALTRDVGSGSSSDYPRSLSYTLDPRDEEKLQLGIERMLRILAAAGAAEIGTHHCEGKLFDVKTGSKEEFENFLKEASRKSLRDLSTPMSSAHQMGSCRMGVEAAVSVVNPKCETWEVEGLFVADTSVFPTALGVNPMVTVQAISYCTAQFVLELLKKKKN